MKLLASIILILTASICYSQEVVGTPSFFPFHKSVDTIRASLLITRGPMRIAHHYEGYVVINNELQPKQYLDTKKQPFKSPVRVWNYIILKQPEE
jgi:hypothetical protein